MAAHLVLESGAASSLHHNSEQVAILASGLIRMQIGSVISKIEGPDPYS